MRLLDSSGNPVKSAAAGATLITMPDWHNMGVAWDHSWDALDATFYTPGAGELAEYTTIDATPRVSTIPDRSGTRPLIRDFGSHATSYGRTLPLPGPQFIAASRRFKRRAAFKTDEIFPTGGPGTGEIYSVLSPHASWNTSDYLNPTAGYAAPYWVAIIGRAGAASEAIWDSRLGSDTAINAGPTISIGNQGGTGTDWSAATWWDDGGGFAPDPTHAAGVLRSSHTHSVDETVLIMVQVTRGSAAAKIYVYWRNAAGYLDSTNVAGTCALDSTSTALRDVFFGWVHSSYVMCAGIKSGTIGLGDIGNLAVFAAPWLPPLGAETSEP